MARIGSGRDYYIFNDIEMLQCYDWANDVVYNLGITPSGNPILDIAVDFSNDHIYVLTTDRVTVGNTESPVYSIYEVTWTRLAGSAQFTLIQRSPIVMPDQESYEHWKNIDVRSGTSPNSIYLLYMVGVYAPAFYVKRLDKVGATWVPTAIPGIAIVASPTSKDNPTAAGNDIAAALNGDIYLYLKNESQSINRFASGILTTIVPPTSGNPNILVSPVALTCDENSKLHALFRETVSGQ